jgi:hypothetical protein
MEFWKTSVRAFLGTAIWGIGWRYHPATNRCVPLTVSHNYNPAFNLNAVALPGTST